jgi:hypothetical protein
MYALPTLSMEKQIEDRRLLLNCSAAFLCALAGIPASRLSYALRGLRPLPNVDGKKLMNLTYHLLEIKEAFSPLPIALVNVDEVRKLLNVMDRKQMTPDDIRRIVANVFEGTNSSTL